MLGNIISILYIALYIFTNNFYHNLGHFTNNLLTSIICSDSTCGPSNLGQSWTPPIININTFNIINIFRKLQQNNIFFNKNVFIYYINNMLIEKNRKTSNILGTKCQTYDWREPEKWFVIFGVLNY